MTILEGSTEQTANDLTCPVWAGPTSAPAFAYPGGKKRLRNTIIFFMPEAGGIFAEPFAGRGNVTLKAATMLHYSEWWLNDLRTAPITSSQANGTTQPPFCLRPTLLFGGQFRSDRFFVRVFAHRGRIRDECVPIRRTSMLGANRNRCRQRATTKHYVMVAMVRTLMP
jgi:hypothetical protein